MEDVEVTITGGAIESDEINAYIERGRRNRPKQKLIAIKIALDGEYVDLDYEYDAIPFERTVRVFEGYLGDLEPVNDGKRAEVMDRVTHKIE